MLDGETGPHPGLLMQGADVVREHESDGIRDEIALLTPLTAAGEVLEQMHAARRC